MSELIANSRLAGSRNFDLVKDRMLHSGELPLAGVLDSNHWQKTFEAHENDFGDDQDAIYTPAITLWALITQVFFKGDMRSCKAAVGRVASLRSTPGKIVCSTNTGAFCRARARITWQTGEISCQIAQAAEAMYDAHDIDRELKQHDAVAVAESMTTGVRILLVDGFTVTTVDTPENQEIFRQDAARKEGSGFPIIRCVSLIWMVTGLLVDIVLGPYAGNQSGETALLWQMPGRLKPGDTLVADCFYCTCWIVAACKNTGVNIVMKNHDKRDNHPLAACRIDKHQRTTIWLRPQ